MTLRKKVSVFFSDFPSEFDVNDNPYIRVLREKYNVELNPQSPDFLIHSVYGDNHIQYDCTKICHSIENNSPDFNWSDYAIGSDYIAFGDRYLHFPIFLCSIGAHYNVSPTEAELSEAISRKTGFCSFLYSNSFSVCAEPVREEFFELLSQYKKVDSGGPFQNNIGRTIPRDKDYYYDNAIQWHSKYKFCIAFENSAKQDYVTEKILNALIANTVPIYWGAPNVGEYFNTKRFINCREYPNFHAVIEKVSELDQNPEKYAEMVRQPWFRDGKIPPAFETNPVFWNFLDGIFEQGPVASKRVVNFARAGMMRRKYRALIAMQEKKSSSDRKVCS